MGFAELKCAVCKGEGRVLKTYDFPFTRAAQVVNCDNCNGEGTIPIHTGAIGSHIISPPIPDECWQDLIDHGSTTYTIKQGEDGQVHTERVDILYKKETPNG